MKKSTQELLGVQGFSPHGLRTDHGEQLYFRIRPSNISVLSREGVTQKIRQLTDLLAARPELEIFCTDAREDFQANRRYLEERADAETNPHVRELLLRDKAFLEDMQEQMSTSRDFVLLLRMQNSTDAQVFAERNRTEKLIRDQGFDCIPAEREDLKRLLARYFGAGQTDRVPEETEGERVLLAWMKGEDVC